MGGLTASASAARPKIMITIPNKWDSSSAFTCIQHGRESGSGDPSLLRRWAIFAKAARTQRPYGCSRRIRPPEPSTNDWAGNPMEPARPIHPPSSATNCRSAEQRDQCERTTARGVTLTVRGNNEPKEAVTQRDRTASLNNVVLLCYRTAVMWTFVSSSLYGSHVMKR
jgi:hypothetical protein